MAKIEQLGGYDPVAEGEQDERGVDLVGIRRNLVLTVSERLAKAEASVNSFLWFRDAIQAPQSRKAA
jgi:hypothetical protein